jgi:hypothetical protein
MKSALLSAIRDRTAVFSKAGMSALAIDGGDVRPVSAAFAADELA